MTQTLRHPDGTEVFTARADQRAARATTYRYGSRQMTLKDAAIILDVTPDTLRQAAHRGTLRAVKVGRQWMVAYREVDRYRHEQRRMRHSDLCDARRDACDSRACAVCRVNRGCNLAICCECARGEDMA